MKNNFKFCPSCGKSIERGNNKIIDCKSCGLHYYLNVYPTVAAILSNREGKLLFVERKNEPKKGYWDLPGGFCEFNENFEKAIKRELTEELGTAGKELFYIGSATDLYAYKGITYNTIIAIYTGIIEENISPADDVASFEFFDKNQFPQDRFAFPGLGEFIRKHITST